MTGCVVNQLIYTELQTNIKCQEKVISKGSLVFRTKSGKLFEKSTIVWHERINRLRELHD